MLKTALLLLAALAACSLIAATMARYFLRAMDRNNPINKWQSRPGSPGTAWDEDQEDLRNAMGYHESQLPRVGSPAFWWELAANVIAALVIIALLLL